MIRVLPFALFFFLAVSARADFLDSLTGKTVLCEAVKKIHEEDFSTDYFFFSKQQKMLWGNSEYQAEGGPQANLVRPALRKRSEKMFSISIKNYENEKTTLTFIHQGNSIKLTRDDKYIGGESRRGAANCTIKGGVEELRRQQSLTVMNFACNGSDISVSCMKEFIRLCGEHPSEDCRQKNQEKLDNLPK